MGAAILGAPGYGGNFMRAVGQGMSQGLQNVQAAEKARRGAMYNQIRNRLWMEQLNNERFRLLGGEQPTAMDQAQMRYWEGQTANKAKENWLRENQLYDGGGSTLPAAPSGYRWTPEGNQEFIPGGPADPSTKAQRKPQGNRESLTALANDVISGLESMAFGEGSIWGTEEDPTRATNPLGPITTAWRASRGVWDYYGQPESGSGQHIKTYVDSARGRMASLVKALGDSGNIGQQEAKNMLASIPNPHTDTRETAKKKMEELKGLLKAALERGASSGGSLPPETGAALPPGGGPTVGAVEDGYRYLGGDPGDPASWEQVQ
jgi:hypothetical protein